MHIWKSFAIKESIRHAFSFCHYSLLDPNTVIAINYAGSYYS